MQYPESGLVVVIHLYSALEMHYFKELIKTR